jgi:hypothetical protein
MPSLATEQQVVAMLSHAKIVHGSFARGGAMCRSCMWREVTCAVTAQFSPERHTQKHARAALTLCQLLQWQHPQLP